MSKRELFMRLLAAGTEDEVQGILDTEGLGGDATKWTPYGANESFYGVVENQQAHPVPALVEKITNGIDAILEKKVLQAGLDVRSPEAPQSVREALDRYFPDHRNWDLGDARRSQARDLQIVASGPRRDTSLLVYDNGVGQAPEDFSGTFLSLLRGNKNDVHFVQGKYNMGGAGAIAFCGDRRFQLVASRRYDGCHPLGFTLLRRHPPELAEAAGRKNTWYEYLVFDGKVPSVDIEDLDIGLEGRRFSTGSILKMYSYRLPEGSRSIISRDLNLSLNEFLFEPALPFLTVDNNERFPDNRAPVTPVYGLKRRLEGDTETIETRFSEVSRTGEFGELGVTVYVFKPRSRGQGVKETKQYVQREYFKNGMTVLFSLNGQVHGSYSSEFVTRALKMPLMKDYVLIHVDCSNLHLSVRNELFMASRDRLKAGEKADAIRKHLRDMLLASELKEIAKRRKSSLGVDSGDAGQMLRDLTRNMPMNDALTKILRQTFNISERQPGTAEKKPRPEPDKPRREPKDAPPFNPQRYPSAFKAKGGDATEGGLKLYRLPAGGSRTIAFATDVENDFFDRTDDPGDMSLAVMRPSASGGGGGGKPDPSAEGDLLDVVRTSPSEGTIRVGLRATAEMKVGDTVEMTATLTSPQGDLTETVLVRITDPERQPPRKAPDVEPPLGIPELVLCSKEGGADLQSWDKVEEVGIGMSHDVVVYPLVDDDKLSRIYVNMDSRVLKDFKSGIRSPEAGELADRRYISAVYFHTLFLFATTKSRKYDLRRGEGMESTEVDLADYVSDLFNSSYAQFLLNFETTDLIDAVS
ncbi:hypothetical protein SOM26_03495 [Sphingomonas sp. CFBP8993]|uniref:hypothetical protein n=1 Tax=Sphingomonas sp. CFBP8993 TaxID=3096526 RepID=UPI002A69958F|nr:hypothetical protein [Sphingomonas sp. CFBP8993]MDY0957745.1 hypothetical protein [Sphingomonas sp. CFBP8993]